MKISIYGDSFVTSGIFKSTLMSQIGNDHNFKLKDVNWPDTPFHNDFGEGNFSKIKEYLGNEEDVINFIEDSEILVTDLAPVSESILDKVKILFKLIFFLIASATSKILFGIFSFNFFSI